MYLGESEKNMRALFEDAIRDQRKWGKHPLLEPFFLTLELLLVSELNIALMHLDFNGV